MTYQHECNLNNVLMTQNLGPLPLESDNVEGRLSRGIIVTITLVAALLLILNVVLISCYVRRRNAAKKQMNGKFFKNIFLIFVFCFVLFSRFNFTCPVPSREWRTTPRCRAGRDGGCDADAALRHSRRSLSLASQAASRLPESKKRRLCCELLLETNGRKSWWN